MTAEQYETVYRIAVAADNAWQAALVREYGKRAGDARYDHRGYATPLLEDLWRAKRTADKDLQIAAMSRVGRVA